MLEEVKIKNTDVKSLKPFIRWAGGKQNLIDEIFSTINFEGIGRYFEPFLGGASFFLKGHFPNSYLSDLNPNLINCYQQVRDNPLELFNRLNSIALPVTSETYYKVREEFNNHNGQQNLDQAIRFIFLNRTSFNGIFRVNSSGKYNVPFGKPDPAFSSLEHLLAVSQKLKHANIFHGYYDEIESLVIENDFIYLDPPYPKLSDTAYFNHYTLDKFDNVEQEKVADFAQKLSAKNSKVVISNADLSIIRDLYSGWNILECSAYRYISCKKEKIKVKELIIRNF